MWIRPGGRAGDVQVTHLSADGKKRCIGWNWDESRKVIKVRPQAVVLAWLPAGDPLPGDAEDAEADLATLIVCATEVPGSPKADAA
jgi:hypothetical protein